MTDATTPSLGLRRTAVAQALVDALRPWVLVLGDATTRQYRQERAELEESRDGRSCTAWLTLEAGDEMDVRVFEALELLALLRAIDPYAYMVSVGMACGYRAIRWLREHPGASLQLGCRINFGFRAQDAAPPIAEQCARLVVGGMEYDAAGDFVTLRSHFENWRRVAAPLLALEIPIEVSVYQGSFEERVLVLHQLVLLQKKRELESDTPRYQHWTPLFRIQKVDPGAFMDYISTTTLLQLTQIAECSVKLDKLCLHGFTATPTSALIVATGLQLLTRAPRVLEADKELQYQGVEELDIPAGLSSQASRAIFSALLDSASTKTVGLNEMLPEWRHDPDRVTTMTAADRRTMWRWAAFALFSELKTNSVQLLRMRVGNLAAEDVDAMRDVLQSTSPLLDLLEIDAHRPEAQEVRSVVCSRFLLSPPPLSSETKVEEVTINCPSQQVRVLSDDGVSDYISVLLPGWGPAWALRADCDECDQVRVSRGQVKTIARVTLCYINESNKPVVIDLLRLIGERMEDLRIVGVDYHGTMDAWVRSMFIACPHLDSFELHDGRIQSLLTIAKCYEDGLTRASQLDFYVELVDTQEAGRFFMILADAEHPMTRRLRSLRIWINRATSPFTGLVSALEAVAARNSHLIDLHLDVKFRDPQHVIPMESVSHIREYSQKPVSVRDRPLAMPDKIAFLSVLQKSGSSAPAQLDYRAITTIFEFAATCKKRTIHIFFMEDRNEEADGAAVAAGDVDGDEENIGEDENADDD